MSRTYYTFVAALCMALGLLILACNKAKVEVAAISETAMLSNNVPDQISFNYHVRPILSD